MTHRFLGVLLPGHAVEGIVDHVERGRKSEISPEEQLIQATGPFWSERRVGEALLMSVPAIRRAVADGRMLGVETDDGQVLFPLWQFTRTREGGIRVRTGVTPMLRHLLGHDPWTIALILASPAPELDGRSPVDLMRDGNGNDVELAELAEVIAAEWSAGTHRSSSPTRR